MNNIPFNKPYMTGKELWYISQAHANGHLAGDGIFTKRCSHWLEEHIGSAKVLLTHSCTAALEMAALLANIGSGDEVIMPSYTFVSTANAFVLRGATPVFVDIRSDTLNIDETKIEAAITPKTKAIIPVHYAGVACEMDTIMAIANKYNLFVIEDAAQAIFSTYKGRPLGSIGHMGCLSFHETKNVISGEGGALLVNEADLVLRAEIIREKGTNRSRFFRGEVDKYTWCEVGSSFLPGELIAAFLWAQLEEAETITNQRLASWTFYQQLLTPLAKTDAIRCPVVPEHCKHNAHMYYVLLNQNIDRQHVLGELKQNNIHSVFHYVPLHSSPGGQHYGRTSGSLDITDRQSEALIRLPLWVGLTEEEQVHVTSVLEKTIS